MAQDTKQPIGPARMQSPGTAERNSGAARMQSPAGAERRSSAEIVGERSDMERAFTRADDRIRAKFNQKELTKRALRRSR